MNHSKEATNESPCLTCKYRDMEGGNCALLCLRLAAYNSGEPWEGKPLPYIAKQKNGKKKVVKMEKTETEDPEDKPEKTEKICVVCHDPDKKILNLRSQTCGACYQAWHIGKIDHPTLGKFKPFLTKSKIKISKKANPEPQELKATQPKKENPIKSTSRSYPFPDIMPLDFSKYPEIRSVIFDRADKFLLPAEHIIFSIIAGALAGKKED